MKVLNLVDYKTRTVPNPAYLDASARRSDGDGLNHAHLARVRAARAARDNHGAVAAPIEAPRRSRLATYAPLVGLFAVAVYGFSIAPRAVQLGCGIVVALAVLTIVWEAL